MTLMIDLMSPFEEDEPLIDVVFDDTAQITAKNSVRAVPIVLHHSTPKEGTRKLTILSAHWDGAALLLGLSHDALRLDHVGQPLTLILSRLWLLMYGGSMTTKQLSCSIRCVIDSTRTAHFLFVTSASQCAERSMLSSNVTKAQPTPSIVNTSRRREYSVIWIRNLNDAQNFLQASKLQMLCEGTLLLICTSIAALQETALLCCNVPVIGTRHPVLCSIARYGHSVDASDLLVEICGSLSSTASFPFGTVLKQFLPVAFIDLIEQITTKLIQCVRQANMRPPLLCDNFRAFGHQWFACCMFLPCCVEQCFSPPAEIFEFHPPLLAVMRSDQIKALWKYVTLICGSNFVQSAVANVVCTMKQEGIGGLGQISIRHQPELQSEGLVEVSLTAPHLQITIDTRLCLDIESLRAFPSCCEGAAAAFSAAVKNVACNCHAFRGDTGSKVCSILSPCRHALQLLYFVTTWIATEIPNHGSIQVGSNS